MFFCCYSEQTVEQTLDWPVIRDAMTVMWHRSNVYLFRRCGLEMWWKTSKKTRTPLLCRSKLCTPFRSHRWIQTGVTVPKSPNCGKIYFFIQQVPFSALHFLFKFTWPFSLPRTYKRLVHPYWDFQLFSRYSKAFLLTFVTLVLTQSLPHSRDAVTIAEKCITYQETLPPSWENGIWQVPSQSAHSGHVWAKSDRDSATWGVQTLCYNTSKPSNQILEYRKTTRFHNLVELCRLCRLNSNYIIVFLISN